eukprot:CCRYP_009164-RA/>CCRYP_009164-RA protein AED:0.15 eAED:0.16 QI:0/0/0/1/1/1/4/0/1045
MEPSRSSPSPASLCTKTLAYSSPAKANPSSSAPVAHKVVTASHSPNTKGGGNHGAPPRRHDKHSDTPTAYRPPIHRTSHQMDACSVWIPVKSTWLKAVQAGNFIGWPLLTSIACRNTSQRQWKLQRAPQPMPQERQVYQTETDSPRNLPVSPTRRPQTTRRNHYLMVMVDIDSSAILVEPIKNRTDIELTRAYSTLITRLHRAGVVPRKHVLDNEISTAMKTLITDTYKMTYELVPPGCHRRNAAEVAIRNFKSHFLSILAGVADDFPMKLWDKLLPQAEITINLLRQSNATPTVSAYAHLNGPFDYNKMPLAPMGCSVQSTNSERLSDTVVFQHKSITHPSLTPTDKLMQAVSACAAALKGITARPRTSPTSRHYSTSPHPPQTPPTVFQGCERPAPPPDLQGCCQLPTRPRPRHTLHDQPAQPDINHTSCHPAPRPTPKTKRRKLPKHATVPDSAPARNTRSHTAAKAKLLAAPATNTRAARVSRIPKPIPILSKRMKRVDKEVHRALAVMDQDTGTLLNYRAPPTPSIPRQLDQILCQRIWRLANGVGGRIKGTNTIRFIRKRDIPKNRLKDITYGQFVCTVRPEKKEPNRTRLVVGGDRINYPGEVATPTADMLAAKILFNSVISTAKARFMTMDISNFYLNTPLKRPEYIRMKLSDIPEEIITEYKLRDLVEPGDCVYIIIVLGMYGLPHAGLIANELLEKRLNQHGYHQSKLVPGLWSHKWRPIWFTLVVGDFGVKYVGKEHALHLKSVLESYYPLSTDWTGNRYIGIRLDWDYNNRKVHLSMPGYKAKALKQFHHKPPSEPQHSPFPTKPIKYGAKKQYAAPPSTAPLLDKKGKNSSNNAIASQSAAPTQDTMTQTLQLLDYLATQEEAVLTYHASDMVLAAHSDASYLSEPQARSRAGGHFFLSSNADIPPNNGAILNIAHIIKHVMASATEAELAALFITARESVYIRIILMELGHKQPATPLQTDNAMAKQSPMGKYNPSAPRPWTCASTGYAIANAENNFEFTGALATAIMLITGPNITRPNIISTYAANSLHR